MLTAFGPFVTDMYLPSLPTMTSFFGTSTSMVQLGLTLTSATTLAMENAREQAGTASALLGAASFLFGSIVSPLVGMGDILVSTGITFVICAAASCLCGWAAIHGHTPHTAVINNGVC